MIMMVGSSKPLYAQVSGTVFRDFNSNGVKDNSTSFNEVGLGNIIITAYDASGQPVAMQTSAANGTYSFPASGTNSIPPGAIVRLEFTGLPSGYISSAAGGTSVQFVTAPATLANYAINYPADYCSTNPTVILPVMDSGDPSVSGAGTASELSTLVSFPYSIANASGTAPTTLASAGKTGSVWGTAYQGNSNKVFMSAFLKRHSGLLGAGLGGIYVSDLSTATPATSLYIDLENLGVDLGQSLLGTRSLPSSPVTSSNDATAFDLVGKIGLGGLAISDDETTLYAMNLYEKKIIQVNIGSPAKAGSSVTTGDVVQYAVPVPTCSGGTHRPFAITYYREKVYAGMICSAESGGTASDLSAYIYEFDPSTATFNTTPILQFALNYPKGKVHVLETPAAWNPWINDWALLYLGSSSAAGQRAMLPQPILSDIDFIDDGDMVLSIMDRAGHQLGYKQRATTGTAATYNGYIGGDLLRAKKTSGVWTLENNGTVGGLTGCGVSNAQGPGNGEFFCGDQYSGALVAGGAVQEIHRETSQGATIYAPGNSTILSIVMDPLSTWSGGATWLDLQAGNYTKRYQIYSTTNDGGVTFGKANGLGDMELACPPAPVEIGNRVWLDADNDGIQDADEAGIGGIQVQLIKSGTTVATATTDAKGNYYFSNATGTSTTSIKYGLTQLAPNMAYTVRFPTTTTVSGTTYNLTTAAAGSNRLIDSNAPASGDVTVLATDIPIAGANNHSFDVGYSNTPCSINNFTVTPACNNNGTPSDATDDYRTFSVIASGTGVAATYNASVTNSGTLTPTSGSYDTATSFRLQNGSAGNGTVYTLTLTDATTSSCTQTATISDPGSCVITSCSLSVTVTPGTCNSATNTYDVTGQLTFSNAPASGTLSATIGSSSSTPITMTNATTSPQSYTITGLTADGVSHTVSASFSADPTCTGSVNYTAPIVCTSGGQPDLQLTKTASTNAVISGQTFTYTITLTNTGTASATNVLVRDMLPTALVFVSSTASQGSYSNTTGIWTVGTVAAGASLTLTITVTVN